MRVNVEPLASAPKEKRIPVGLCKMYCFNAERFFSISILNKLEKIQSVRGGRGDVLEMRSIKGTKRTHLHCEHMKRVFFLSHIF